MTENPQIPGPCPCGSGQGFSSCCRPLIDLQVEAKTALQLMRSRYTAYVIGRSDYLHLTWAPVSRPRSLDLEAEKVKWLGLEIHRCTAGLATDDEGEVAFTASFIAAGMLCRLLENSRFTRVAGKWLYVDGDDEMERWKIERNAACPCSSGKKFKRCCGRT
jgi:SEC-C motif domain protein